MSLFACSLPERRLAVGDGIFLPRHFHLLFFAGPGAKVSAVSSVDHVLLWRSNCAVDIAAQHRLFCTWQACRLSRHNDFLTV